MGVYRTERRIYAGGMGCIKKIQKDFDVKIVDKSSEALFSLLLNNVEAALVTKASFDLAIASDATSYRITATPKDSMKNDCSFTITNAGVRSYTKGSKCTNVNNW